MQPLQRDRRQDDGGSPTWFPLPQRGSSTEVAAIYDLGVSDGREMGRQEEQERMEAMMREKFMENINRSILFTLRLMEMMEELGYVPLDVRMSTDGIFDFDILFIVTMKDALSSRFLEVYEGVAQIESEMSDTTFNPRAQFLSVTSPVELNNDTLTGDGFTYTLKGYDQT